MKYNSLKTRGLLGLLFVLVPLITACQGGSGGGGGLGVTIGQDALQIPKSTGGMIFVANNSFDGDQRQSISGLLLGAVPPAQLAPITWVASNASDESSMKQLLQEAGEPVGDGVLVDLTLPIQDGLLQGVGTQIVYKDVLTPTQQTEWGTIAGSAKAPDQSFGVAYDNWVENSSGDLSGAITAAQGGNVVPLQEALFVASLFYGDSPVYTTIGLSFFQVGVADGMATFQVNTVTPVTFSTTELSIGGKLGVPKTTFSIDPSTGEIQGVQGQPNFPQEVPIPEIFIANVPSTTTS
jgi:hypothetical protein